jgi:uncharacterized protein YndB with AHSA1/START domain
MNKLHVEAEHTAQAAAEIVWALVSDATKYPQWGPWRKAEYRSPGVASPHGQGAVYWLQSSRRYGLRYPFTLERILEFEEGRRLAYAVLKGIPVRNYRAEITLTPTADGTRIRWTADWDRTVAGRLAYRPLSRLYPQVVADLAAAAEKQAAAGAGRHSGSAR